MKRVFAVAVVPLFTFLFLLFGGSGTLRAQNANPVSTHLKGQWTNIRDLLTKEADRMPEENYRFKPAPEMEDFGQRMAHVITFSMRGCAAVKGEQKQLKFGTPPSKAEVTRSEEHTSELQSHVNLVCRLLLEKKKTDTIAQIPDVLQQHFAAVHAALAASHLSGQCLFALGRLDFLARHPVAPALRFHLVLRQH